jgi:hypothetical protein
MSGKECNEKVGAGKRISSSGKIGNLKTSLSLFSSPPPVLKIRRRENSSGRWWWNGLPMKPKNARY